MAKKTEVKQEEFKDEEIVKDEDGLVTNISQIKKEKETLLNIYNELVNLNPEELDAELSKIKAEIEERINLLQEIEANEAKRFDEAREQQIREHQRVSTDHFLKTKEDIVKQGRPPRLPYTELCFLLGMVAIIILLIVILCNVI